MNGSTQPRGATLIEAMFSMAVLMIGASGLAGMHRQTQIVLGDAQRLSRATVIAQDLVAQIDSWDFDDPRLANANLGNDADLGDTAGQFLTQATPPADHGEGDLAAGLGAWNGLPTSFLQEAGMERYWNVSYPDDANANGVPDAVRVAVIVRWQQGGGWRRVVFMTAKANPADIR